MNINRYDKDIQEMYYSYRMHLQEGQPMKAIAVLKKMERRAQESHDQTLNGFTYATMANVEYFETGRYDQFIRYMGKAVHCILSGGSDEELKEIYYLISLDALAKGMYDLAYHYSLNATRAAEEYGQTGAAAILCESTGYHLLLMGEYRQSIRFTKRAEKVLRGMKEHPYYHYNLATAYVNEATARLNLGQTKQAEQMYRKTMEFFAQNEPFLHEDARFAVALLGARIDVALRRHKKSGKRLKELIVATRNVLQIFDYIEDIRLLTEALIEDHALDEAGRLLQEFEKKETPADATNARRVLIDLKIRYLKAAGKTRALYAAYSKQDEIYLRLLAEQKRARRYMEDLIRLTGELRREQAQVRAANEELMRKARTDMLCNIPNRYALNEKLETAFERAFQEKTPLGVCIIDMNSLKTYNDTYGHQAGDRLLASFGIVLSALTTDERIFAARYGGDEFVLVFERMSKAEIQRCLSHLRDVSEGDFSAGLYHKVPAEKNKIWDYLSRADKALYQEKTASGGKK